MGFMIEWIDRFREPQCAPDPEFPDGKDIDIAGPDCRACQVDLPYPAKRCGVYVVACPVCQIKFAITTAGRPDDPKSVRIPCKESLQ